MATKILLVEDEAAIREMVALVLLQQGYDVAEAADYRSAIRQVGQQIPHLVLLDWMLPGKSGLQFLQYLKQHEECSKVPVVMLTAKSEEKDCIACLNAGADDYVTKPFHTEELVARLRVQLRRTGRWTQAELSCGPIRLNTSEQRVHVNNDEVTLTAYEYRVLEHLMLHAGEVVSKTRLTDSLYEEDADRDSNVIEVFIRRLRIKLDPTDTLKPIETLRGRGYRFTLTRT